MWQMQGGKKELSAEEKYDLAYKNEGYAGLSASLGWQMGKWALAHLKFQSVLEVGCGSGFALLEFLRARKLAVGTEICRTLLEGRLRSLTDLGMVKKAYMNNLPFSGESFDLVFSAEVLEHIPEVDVGKSISELVRVAKRRVFVSVCFKEAKCFPELNLHETVQPASWWEKHFNRFRVKVQKVSVGDFHEERGGCYVLTKY